MNTKQMTAWGLGVCAAAVSIALAVGRLGATEDVASVEELAKRAAVLAHEVQLLQDQNDIENLQRIYGFYIDKGMWSQAADLFADDGELEIGGRGVYIGKARVLDYLRQVGAEGPAEGRLYDNMQLQPIVHVAADGQTARARWRFFSQLAQHGKFHEWGSGIEENDYVKEGGVWKIRKLHLFPTMYSPYEKGWGKVSQPYSSFEPRLPPDRPPTAPSLNYESVFVPPFHYENPVTGKPLPATADSVAAPSAATLESVEQSVADLSRRLGRVEDFAQIENLQMTYGYYLATLLWDDLAELFAEDGTIEIAMRGVYVGKAAVRRNLDLYGRQGGLDEGVLHNHMQYQPVIHIAEDGQTARLRSRAFSMMGNFGHAGMWMGGTYENELVKVNGQWKFRKDQQINTYFAPYDVGWKDLAPRPPPGITEANPPDRPPSLPFELYPKSFLPPYHYSNPVTGKPAVWPPQS